MIDVSRFKTDVSSENIQIDTHTPQIRGVFSFWASVQKRLVFAFHSIPHYDLGIHNS